jgi:hypothetical protein
MGQGRYFHPQHKELLKEAAVIAEEMTFDYFKLHPSHWRRARYDILTLEGLRQEEISPHAHALVAKYKGCPPNSSLQSAWFDFYRVCLQDHNILKTLESCPDISLLPLLLYIITHELVHVIRFSQFLALFEASEAEKVREESQVHHLTKQILQPLNYIDLPPVIRYYQ